MKPREKFTQIENAIIQSEILSGSDKLFYLSLKSFRNQESKLCCPSIRKICELCKIHKETAYNSRKKLLALGVIEFESIRGRKQSCHYRFLLEDGTAAQRKRALDNLMDNSRNEELLKDSNNSRNKELFTVLNSRNTEPLNSRNKDRKIVGNGTYNNTCITKQKEQHSVCVPSREPDPPQAIPPQVQTAINEIIEAKKSNGGFTTSEAAYRRHLEKSYFDGTFKMPKDDVESADDAAKRLYGNFEDFDLPEEYQKKYREKHTNEIVDEAYMRDKLKELVSDGIFDATTEFSEWWPKFFKLMPGTAS